MSRSHLAQSSRLAARATTRTPRASRPFLQTATPSSPATTAARAPLAAASRSHLAHHCSFSTCAVRSKGIMPETENPAKSPAAETSPAYTLVELSDSQYHEIADVYLENALNKFEELQDQSDAVDVEYSSGVMTIRVPEKGTYVLNKQPPNKQIWLSSPISGPKRYDWCVIGDGQYDKEDTAAGRWVYSRDSSTLDQLILEEIGVDLQEPLDG